MSNPYDEQPTFDPNQPNQYPAGAYQPGHYGGAPQPHPQGTTVLVLGIVGLVVCFIPGIVGLVLGSKALKEIDSHPGAYNNRQHIVVGRILGIIGIVWQVLVILAYVLILVLALATTGVAPR